MGKSSPPYKYLKQNSHYTYSGRIEVPTAQNVFLEKVQTCILENLSNEYFGAKELADMNHLSLSQLNRKLKTFKYPSAAKFIMHIRMQHAASILMTNTNSISDIGASVGYKDPAHFCRSFKRFFNYPPSTYRKINQLNIPQRTSELIYAQNWQKNAQN